MRNCEQLLDSLGLFAHHVGSLDSLNKALSDHGPESCKGFPRVTVKEKPGQQTEVKRHNIKVASFSGWLTENLLQLFFNRHQFCFFFNLYHAWKLLLEFGPTLNLAERNLGVKFN